jgi:hypothetical protein
MMSDLIFALEATRDGLNEKLDELEAEIDNLDPSATEDLKTCLWRLRGIQAYLIERIIEENTIKIPVRIEE